MKMEMTPFSETSFYNKPHGATSKKAATFIVAAVITSNATT
jgi:hypothetical protein